MLGEQVLSLDALPVLQSAEIGNYCQLADSTHGLKCFDLANDFVGRADETDLLPDDLLVG